MKRKLIKCMGLYHIFHILPFLVHVLLTLVCIHHHIEDYILHIYPVYGLQVSCMTSIWILTSSDLLYTKRGTPIFQLTSLTMAYHFDH